MNDPASPRQRVLVVAAIPALRAGLVALLGSDSTLEPLPAEDVLLQDNVAVPAAIVADFTTGEPANLSNISDAYPNSPLVLLGAEPAVDGPGLGGPPVAYLPGDVDAVALTAAVHAAAAGLIVLDPTIAGAAAARSPSPTSADADMLTARELEVLQLVAEGYPNKSIARELGISEHTAKFHVGSLLGKLGAASRTEAVTLATRRGILHV